MTGRIQFAALGRRLKMFESGDNKKYFSKELKSVLENKSKMFQTGYQKCFSKEIKSVSGKI